MSDIIVTTKMPVLALRGMTVFPEQTVHFDVGRMKSALALEKAMKQDQTIFLAPQKDISVDDPRLQDLYPIGTVVKVKQILKSQGENIRVLVTGLYRAKITEMSYVEPFLCGTVEKVPEVIVSDTLRLRALRREANNLYATYLEFVERPGQSVQLRMMAAENSGFIADSIAQNSGIDFLDKVKMLSQLNPVKRLEMAVKLLLEKKIRFVQIPEIIRASMEHHKKIAHPNLEEILQTERETYEFIEQEMKL